MNPDEIHRVKFTPAMSRLVKSTSVNCFECGYPLGESPTPVTNNIRYELPMLLVITDDPKAIRLLEEKLQATRSQVVDYFIFVSCWKEQFPDLPRRPLLAADENYKLDQLRQCFDGSGLTMEILHTPPLSPEEYDEADKIVPK